MKSTHTSSKNTPQCPSISADLVEWLDGVFPAITTSQGFDIRELDHMSGAREVIDYLKGQLEKQRS